MSQNSKRKRRQAREAAAKKQLTQQKPTPGSVPPENLLQKHPDHDSKTQSNQEASGTKAQNEARGQWWPAPILLYIATAVGLLSKVPALSAHPIATIWIIFVGVVALTWGTMVSIAKYIGLQKAIWTSTFTTLGLLLACVSFQRVESRRQELAASAGAFDVACTHIFAGRTRNDPPWFWIVWHKQVAYPALAIRLLFTNLKPVPTMLAFFEIETESEAGWQKVRIWEVKPGDEIFGCWGPGINPLRLEFGNGTLSSKLEGKALAPHESVVGIVFMEMPKSGLGKAWRFRITEINGSESVQNIRGVPQRPTTASDLQTLDVKVCERRDISKLPRAYLDP